MEVVVTNGAIMRANLVKSRSSKCSLGNAKRAFYRAANSIFGKIDRISSEEVSYSSLRVNVYLSYYMALKYAL